MRLQKKKEGEETVTNESLSLSLSRISREIPLNETVDDFQRLLQRSSSVRITFYQSPGWQLGADCAFNAMNAIVITFSPPFLLPSPRALVSWNSNFAPRTEETAPKDKILRGTVDPFCSNPSPSLDRKIGNWAKIRQKRVTTRLYRWKRVEDAFSLRGEIALRARLAR